MLRDGCQQPAGPLSSRRYGRFGNAGGQRQTADFESAKSRSFGKGRGGNKKTSELGQDRGCCVGGGFESNDAPGNLKAVPKKNEYRFCRARTWLKPKQVAQDREEKEKQLKILWWLYLGGRIDLYFGDESAFSMNPKLPYGWSPKGERIQIFPQRDKKVNLFGVFRPDNFCLTYESDGNINADFLIRSINDCCRYVKKPTVLVLDNAPTHRSRKFIAQMEKWMEQDLYIFFLPKYSPHLNIAETFWRKAKYEWLRPSDYGSFAKYKKKVKAIFTGIGSEYKIAFSQMTV